MKKETFLWEKREVAFKAYSWRRKSNPQYSCLENSLLLMDFNPRSCKESDAPECTHTNVFSPTSVVIPPKKIQPDFLYILLIISEVLIRRVIMTGNTKYLLATRKEIKVYKKRFSMVKKKA